MSQAATYEQNDPGFVQDLQNSQAAVDRAAKWLSGLGYPVVVRPIFVRPDAAQMRDYADDGDLEIMQRIEVKRRQTLTFTCAKDYPYQSVIVDICHTFDNARPKPHAYIIFNQSMTVALIVKSETRSHWRRVTKRDRFKNRDRHFYECPVGMCQFIKVRTEDQHGTRD